jgi:multiple sugar transport system substrate-binding protein
MLLPLLAVALLSGCAGRNASTDQSQSTAGGKTLINYWNGFTGPDGRAMEKIVAQFQKQNPDVAVRMQIIPWGTYYDKLTLSMAYGGAPDVFVMHAGRLPEFATFDTIRPLDDLYAAAPP